MKVKCINHGNFKNITINQEYEVSEVLDEFYVIYANDGTERKYSKAYFEEMGKEVIEEILPEQPKVKNVDIGVIREDSDSIKLFFNNEHICSFNIISGVAGSCGIISINGITYLYERITELYEENDYSESIVTVFEKSINKILELLIEETSVGLILFSTNDAYSDIFDVMDGISDFKSDEFLNPNSDNYIKLWGFYINQP